MHVRLVQVVCTHIIKHHIRASALHQLEVFWRTCGDYRVSGATSNISLNPAELHLLGDGHLTA